MKESEIAEFISQMRKPETLKLIYWLAVAFTGISKIERVPDGTHVWVIQTDAEGYRLLRKDQNGRILPKNLTIKLIPFFGMLIAYSKETDTLLFCNKGESNA